MNGGEELVVAERTLIILLIVISAVAILVRRIRLPYTVALVLGGLAIAVLRPFPGFELTAEVILFIFIPPLVFEAAFHLDIEELRENLAPILGLAVAGVLLSTVIIGGIITLAGVPLVVALVFGALITATDPVAVIAVFRELGVSRRLAHIVEGESLFNDGTSIVLYRILLAVLVSGVLDVPGSLVDFLFVTVGGLGLGSVVGLVISQLIRRIDDYLIEITLTTITAYGTYLVAEELHMSGVIAVVVAGIILGNYGARIGMSPTTRIVLTQVWEYVAFIANSFIFLLMGLTIELDSLVENAVLILWAIGAVLVGRAAVIYVLGALLNRLSGTLPSRYRHVLFWGGLRGAISLALALALPFQVVPWRGRLLAMTFGVVLFTLLVQGTTIPWLLSRMGLTQRLPRGPRVSDDPRPAVRQPGRHAAPEQHGARRRPFGFGLGRAEDGLPGRRRGAVERDPHPLRGARGAAPRRALHRAPRRPACRAQRPPGPAAARDALRGGLPRAGRRDRPAPAGVGGDVDSLHRVPVPEHRLHLPVSSRDLPLQQSIDSYIGAGPSAGSMH